MRRVVVTGMGMVTPVGHDLDSTWSSLWPARVASGRSGCSTPARFPTRIAAEVHDFRLDDYFADAGRWAEHSRNSKFALAAAAMAMKDSGLAESRRSSTGGGSASTSARAKGSRISRGSSDWCKESTARRPRRHVGVHPPRDQGAAPDPRGRAGAGDPLGTPGERLRARGPNANCLTACAASSQAIGEAFELIRRGSADVILSGGTHSMIHPFGVTGFILLTALSTRNDEPTRASRPFDRDRDGFILGEGAGMLVLEELEHAKASGARIHGEVVGYGSTADAFRITDSHDEGRGAIACIKEALACAGLDPADIDYINAHGTSTAVNDSIETLAIKRAFGEQAYKVPISSTKSMMGHLIAAAGSVEAIVCLLAIRDGVLPPTINLDNPDPECDLDYVPQSSRASELTWRCPIASGSAARTSRSS